MRTFNTPMPSNTVEGNYFNLQLCRDKLVRHIRYPNIPANKVHWQFALLYPRGTSNDISTGPWSLKWSLRSHCSAVSILLRRLTLSSRKIYSEPMLSSIAVCSILSFVLNGSNRYATLQCRAHRYRISRGHYHSLSGTGDFKIFFPTMLLVEELKITSKEKETLPAHPVRPKLVPRGEIVFCLYYSFHLVCNFSFF